MPWYLGNGRVNVESFLGVGIGILALWSLVWSAMALWHSARRGHNIWFIVFLLVHTLGILEFIYLMFVAKIFTTPANHLMRRKK